jgi:hypothetical protein
MGGKREHEEFERLTGLLERLAMTNVVAGRGDGEERPGRVGTANREESREAEPHEDWANYTEFGRVAIKGKDDPAAKGPPSVGEHGDSQPGRGSIRNS